MIGVFRIYLLALVFSLPLVAFAAPAANGGVVSCTGVDCTVCDIADTAQKVINAGIYVIVFLSSVLFAYAGWLHVAAGGDTGAASRARTIFTNTAIGLVIILSAWLVVDVIMKTLFRQPFGPWNKLCEIVVAQPWA